MVNCVKGLTRGENRWATIFMSQVGHEIGWLVASPFCWHGGWWHAQLAVRVRVMKGSRQWAGERVFRFEFSNGCGEFGRSKNDYENWVGTDADGVGPG
jgi:hypothetical protein